MQLLFDIEYLPEPHTGHLSPTQDVVDALNKIYDHTPFTNILEFGFNTGWSSAMFLTMFPNVSVTSIEIFKSPNAQQGAQILDHKFPKRFDIVWGDSKQISHDVIQGNMTLSRSYDTAFIDGGHYPDIVDADIKLCKHLGIKNFIFDDANAPNIQPALENHNLKLIQDHPYSLWIKKKGTFKGRRNKGWKIGIQHYTI
jgi:predicted O-methyltransferase YrrM